MDNKDIAAMKKFIEDFYDPALGIKINTSRILGIAIHIAGDTYAHRVLIPSYSDLKNGVANGGCSMETLFHDINEIKDYISKKQLKTSQLRRYANDGYVDTVKKLLIDNPNFLSTRYSVAAAWASKRLLILWNHNADYGPYIFAPNVTSVGCREYRIDSLVYHLFGAYMGHLAYDNNGIDYTTELTADDWYKLSGYK